jgi:Dockerin type I domain/Secretion system C-terminal sorting domain
MKKMNFTSQILRFSSLLMVFLTLGVSLNAQAPCIVAEKVKVPLNVPTTAPGCKHVLTVADLGAPAGSTLSIRKGSAAQYSAVFPYDAASGITFGISDLYNEYEIMVTDPAGKMCYSYVTPVDADAPVVDVALPNVYIRCTDLVAGKIPGPEVLGSYLGYPQFTDPNSTEGRVINAITSVPNRYGQVRDCSDFYISYSDTYGPINCSPDYAGCNFYQIVTRKWSFKDIRGNSTATTVDQIITVVQPRILFGTLTGGDGSVATPFTYTDNKYDCNADGSAIAPTIDWTCWNTLDLTKKGYTTYLTTEDMTLGKDYCGWVLQKTNTATMPLCAGSKMYTNSFKLKRCDNKYWSINQVLNVWDRTSPNVKLEYTDFLRVKEKQCFNMGGRLLEQYVYKTVAAIGGGSVTGGQNLLGTSMTAMNMPNGALTTGSFKITPLVNTGTCNTASISIKLTADDLNCSKGDVVLSSNRPDKITFNGMTTMKLVGGTSVTVKGSFTDDTEVHIYATDDCGNVTDVKLTIVVLDNLAPNSYCEDKQVSLNNKGEVIVTPATFSSNQVNGIPYADNCVVTLPEAMDRGQFIRRTTATNDGCWTRDLAFTCADGDAVKVDIRTVDMMGNYTDCCVTLTMVNKVGPSCLSFMDVTKECTDPKLANIESLFTQPTYYAPCGNVTISSNKPVLDLGCGAGSATKTWTFTANGQSVSCSQKLTVTNVAGYRVKPLVDEVVTCNYTYDESAERAKAIAQVKLLDAQGVVTCSAPIVEVEKWEYSNTQFCKIIRIRYSFVDKCQKYAAYDLANRYVHYNQLTDFDGDFTTKYADGYYQSNTYDYNGGKTLLFGYERFIMVNDKTAPTSTPPTIADICLGDNCKFNISTTVSGSDKCDDGSVTNSGLAFNWSVTNSSGSVIATGVTSTISTAAASTGSLTDLAAGTYTVGYTVSDFCGNKSFYSFKVTGKDCKAPFVLVHEKQLELGYDSRLGMGMGQVCVIDVLNNLGDNCSSYDYLLSKTRIQRAADAAVYSETLPTCLTFTCADKGRQTVRIWTRDEAGNANFVLDYITVQDNVGACTVTPLSTIAGTLKTESGQAVKDVTVSASVSGTIQGTNTVDATGNFTVKAPLDANVQVKAVKIATEDKYAGVTTFDIARISKHLLDIEKFSSPYSMIAADVNKDGEVDATDMLQIRNFILRKTTSLPGGVWRFIDKSYTFTNAANPFGEDFPEVINLSKVPATATANFVAVKLGDVNTTYTSALTGVQVRNNNALTLQAEEMQLVAGNEYTVNITADNFNATAFQGTLSLNGATVKSVKGGDISNYTDGNFGVFGSDITTSWNGTSKLNANVMSITFVANKTAKLSEVLTVGSSLTPAVANDIQGNEMNVNLKFTSGKVSGSEFALYQNTPNPVSHETTIGFNLSKDESARLTVYSVEGKTILSKVIEGKSGANQVTINKSELNANGVMYYRVETAEHTATKKMIIIE